MPLPSTSPTWLITGTSSGLGLALSQYILKQGHNLISISRHPKPDPSLFALSNPISLTTPAATTTPLPTLLHIPLDLSSPPTPILPSIPAHLHPTILVNNAALTTFSPLEHTTPSTLLHILTTNFITPTAIIRALLPGIRASTAGHEKVIVNISSTQGICTDASETAYDSSKHALEGMSGVLAKEVEGFGVRVLVVQLGSLRTGFAGGDRRKGERSEARDEQVGANGGKSREGDETGTEVCVDVDVDDPYADPSHPVAQRMAGVRKLVDVPGLAKGDVQKTAAVLFDAVMRTEGSVVDEVLEGQRARTRREGKGGQVERLVLGSDAQPKIERVLERYVMDVEACRVISGSIEAD